MRGEIDSEVVGVISRHAASYRSVRLLAWAFLIGAFAIFVLAVVFLPRAVASALGSLTTDAPFKGEAIQGTVLVKGPNDLAWKHLEELIELSPETRISTDGTSRAFLELFEGSTVQLYNNTELEVAQSLTGRFNQDTRKIGLQLFRGRALIGVAYADREGTRDFSVLANRGNMRLLEGSYLIELLPDERVEVLALTGKATLFNGGGIAEVGMGGRAAYQSDLPPVGDLSVLSPLLADPHFIQPIGSGPWRPFVVTEAGVDGQVSEAAVKASPGDWPGLDLDFGYRFRRMSDTEVVNRHGEAGISQIVNRDVRDYSNLRIEARVVVGFQGLSGGGSAGTEYPIMLKIYYVDSSGQDQIWYHGFYYQNDDGFSVSGASEVPKGEWTVYDNPSLMQAIKPTPVFIRRVEVLGSGWGFDSWVAEVSLEGR